MTKNGNSQLPAPASPPAPLDVLRSDGMKNAIVPLIQKHVSPERFMSMAISCAKAFLKKPNVVGESIVLAIYQAATLGLEPGDVLGHAHLVPFKKKGPDNVWRTYAQLIPGYRGLLHLARQSGKVHDMKVFIVYEADHFRHYVGSDNRERVDYVPFYGPAESKGRKVAILVLTYWTDPNMEPRVDVIPYEKIASIGEVQIKKAKDKDTPWTTHRDEMDIKTAIRRVCKTLPQTQTLAKAVALDEQQELGRLDAEIPAGVAALIGQDYGKELEEAAEETSASSKPLTQPPTAKSEPEVEPAQDIAQEGPSGREVGGPGQEPPQDIPQSPPPIQSPHDGPPPSAGMPDPHAKEAMSEVEFAAAIDRIKTSLEKSGWTQSEMEMKLVSAGYCKDDLVNPPAGDRRKVAAVLAEWMEAGA